MEFDSNQIIGGLIGLGLVAKGLADWLSKKNTAPPPVARGCLYGDAAHADIKKLLEDRCREINDKLIEILAIVRDRK